MMGWPNAVVLIGFFATVAFVTWLTFRYMEKP